MKESNLIITISGIRGIFGKNLNIDIVKKIAITYGLWLNSNDKRVIIGTDTRPSSKVIEKAIIEGLVLVDYKVINLGVCPTPIIIYIKKKLSIPGGIIITGSHNPPEWNGLKLLSMKTFLSNSELDEISNLLGQIKFNRYKTSESAYSKSIITKNAIPDYINALYTHFKLESIRKNNNLRVVVDTGAGTGNFATPQILEGLGCEVKVINNKLDEHNNFPREIEPIKKNLKDLVATIREGKYDLGFAHDSDADRLAIIGDDGTYYPEDIGLALIASSFFKQYKQIRNKVIFITNLASSLMFEVLADKYNAQIIRTPIGERYLAEKIDNLIKKEDSSSVIFGGEGSCGGVMIPQFNNTRDGIFAAAKIVEILVKTNEKISDLVSKLPKFYAFREYINTENKNLKKIINQLRKDLITDGANVNQIDMDLRFGQGSNWFVLIHPSNTEPIIRIISEANNENLAKKNLTKTSERVKSIISRVN
ncbi:MAG: hypothetical protein ACFFDO_01075 [Candidatus Thorarchaeota archaeon]